MVDGLKISSELDELLASVDVLRQTGEPLPEERLEDILAEVGSYEQLQALFAGLDGSETNRGASRRVFVVGRSGC